MKLGILGGGQLGRMLALAAYPLGMRVRVFDPAPDACAGQVAEHVVGDFEDRQALERFAEGLDAVTFEWENVPAEAARFLAERRPFYPTPPALEVAQDRLEEKTLFRSLGIETAPFQTVDSQQELQAAIESIGLPAVLKTRRLGYDGKGQYVLRTAADAGAAWEALGGVPLILEGFVAFQRELSIVAVRGTERETRFYPLAENHHRDGILRLSLAPAPQLSESMQRAGEQLALAVLQRLDYTGVLAIELFEVEGRLLANELASRVHNSGHWTLDGAVTSQFENHVRAIAGLPLGSTEALGASAMINLIGSTPDRRQALALPGTHLHLYGKEPRPGRKLGHINLLASDHEALQTRLEVVQALAGGQAPDA
jgi:5-(carboxyamino)imidazole ribonucleotide synthase